MDDKFKAAYIQRKTLIIEPSVPFSRSLYCSAIHYSLFRLGKINITHVLLQIDPNYYTNQTHELEAYSHTHKFTIHKIVEMHFTDIFISLSVSPKQCSNRHGFRADRNLQDSGYARGVHCT